MAIASDSVAEMAALQTKLPQVTLLTDLDQKAAIAWGVHYPGADDPTPSTFVVRDGLIRYQRIEQRGGDWPTYPELAAALGTP